MDLSSVDPEGLDFARDGKVLADAYLAFIETFEQDIYDVITVADVLAIINGEVDDLPEQAFLNVGTIDDAKEKARKLMSQVVK